MILVLHAAKRPSLAVQSAVPILDVQLSATVTNMAGLASDLSGAAVRFRVTLNPNSFPYVVNGIRPSPKLEQNMWTGSLLSTLPRHLMHCLACYNPTYIAITRPVVQHFPKLCNRIARLSNGPRPKRSVRSPGYTFPSSSSFWYLSIYHFSLLLLFSRASR